MAKVLVVDDSLSVRKVVERALLGRQMEVVCAASGSEALERIELDEPDVVVCDVVMPDKDGYEICDFVKRHPRLWRTPVLLMSGIVNDDVRQRAARAKSADVLSKPFAADELFRRLDALLAAEPAASAPGRSEAVLPSVTPATMLPPPPVLNRPTSPDTANDRRENHNGHVEPRPPAPVAPPALVASVQPAPALPPPPALSVAPAPRASVALAPGPIVTPPAAPSPAPATSSAVLEQLAAIEGVQWAVLADREGFLLDASGEDVVDAAVASALSACLTESSEGLGRELGRGHLHGMILEYAQGMVVLYSVGASALLAIALSEPAALGKVRYFAKKSISDLLQAV